MSQSTTTGLPSEAVTYLRAAAIGAVIAPGDDGYDAARTVFYSGFDRRPSAIIRAADTSDVAQTIAVARSTGLELAVRSGGHSLAGHSISEGGIVLDLSGMRGLEINPGRRTAWAETGLTAGESEAVQPRRWAVTEPSTGWSPCGVKKRTSRHSPN